MDVCEIIDLKADSEIKNLTTVQDEKEIIKSEVAGVKSTRHTTGESERQRFMSGFFCVFFCFTAGVTLLSCLFFGFRALVGMNPIRLASREIFAGTLIFQNVTENSDIINDPDEETAVTEPEPDVTSPEPEVNASYPIVTTDLSSNAKNAVSLKNETGYSPDIKSLLNAPLPIESLDKIYSQYGSDAPVVLLVHTHGTESYSKDDAASYTISDSFRSDDPLKNVLSVGALMADVFEKAGINTIHCTEMFDKESYKDSYKRSAEAISQYLKKFPSVRYIFDIHRDSIIDSEYRKYCPVTEVYGAEVAQVMLVVGTDEKGAKHPDWQDNLSLALKIQNSLGESYSSLMRPINLRGAAFNQGYSNGSLLLEIGSCGNTLIQAQRAGILTASAIAEQITNKPLDIKELLASLLN